MVGHSPTRFVETIFNRVTDTGEPIQIGRIKAKKIWIFGSFDNERVRQRDHGATNDNHECTRIVARSIQDPFEQALLKVPCVTREWRVARYQLSENGRSGRALKSFREWCAW